jgi:hypothetical protein
VYVIQGTASKAEAAVFPTPVSSPVLPASGVLSTSSVIAYVRQEAALYGVNPVDALFIVAHESQDGQNLVGHEPNGSTSYGFWQFNDANPDFDESCAMNLQCSTQLAMQWILAGKIARWSTWRFRCTMYPYDFPPNC